MRYLARVGETEFQIEVTPRGGGRFTVSLDGKTREIERRGDGTVLWLSIDGQAREAAVVREDGAASGGNGRPAPAARGEWCVVLAGRQYAVTLFDPQRRRDAPGPPILEGPVEVRAVMPGKVTALLVREGQEVRSGQGVLVVEAMKMENE